MKKVLFWLPLAVCTYLALTPDSPNVVGGVSDIVLHLGAFGYLTFALWWAHFAQPWQVARTPVRGVAGRDGAAVALWMTGYGVAIEVLQTLFPERTPEVKDLLVDLVGIAIGLGAFWLFATLRDQIFGA